MLLAVLFLLQLHVSTVRPSTVCPPHAYWKADNGKLVHDMRTFINVTYDWNSRDADIVIPKCHEERIRMSYIELPMRYTNGYRVTDTHNLRPGHLIYPLTIRVANGTASQREYFAAGVHLIDSDTPDLSGFSNYEIDPERTNHYIQLVIVPESTWTCIWNRWKEYIKKGNDLCEGGKIFEDLIDRIFTDVESKPQYDDVFKNYTEMSANSCDYTKCYAPEGNKETMTLAYSTEEGMERIEQYAAACCTDDEGDATETPVNCIRWQSHRRLVKFMQDYYWRKKVEKSMIFGKGILSTQEDYRVANCVFYPPYC